MIRRNPRRPAFAALVVALLVGVVGGAFADTYEPTLPPFPDPHFLDPQVLVTPDDGLVNGQTVQVTGKNLGADATGGTLQQCILADLTVCEAPRGSFTTGSNGQINPVGAPFTPNDPPTIPVPFTVMAIFVTPTGQVVNCFTTVCAIKARMVVGSEDRSGAHHISFQGGVTTSSTTPTSTSSTSTSTTTPTSTSSSTSSTTSSSTSSTSTSTSSTTSSTTSSSTSTTVANSTTTTAPPAPSVCQLLVERRSAINAQFNLLKATYPALAAQFEAYRTTVVARLNQELAARGCTAPTA